MDEEMNPDPHSAFRLAAKEKYIGTLSGWHVDIRWTEEMQRHQMIMRLVLMDNNCYGW